MKTYWLLQYSVAGRTWYMMPDQRATKDKRFAQKFSSEAEASEYMAEFPGVWMYTPAEIEFEESDFEPQRKEFA